MRIKTAILIIGAICLIPHNSQSIDANGIFWESGGVGAISCPEFVGAMEEGRRHEFRKVEYVNATYPYRVYLWGFQQAYNNIALDTCDIFSNYSDEQQLAWLENHCRSHPEGVFGRAVVALGIDRHPKRSMVCR